MLDYFNATRKDFVKIDLRIFRSQSEALRSLKLFSLKSFHCLSGGRKIILRSQILFPP